MTAAGRILLIEDDPDISRLLEHRLRRAGYEVRSAVSGEKGVDLATVWRPDVIILDLILPGISGWEVMRLLRTGEATRDIPVVISSILDETPQRQIPPQGYLVKPFRLEELEAVLSPIVGGEHDEPGEEPSTG